VIVSVLLTVVSAALYAASFPPLGLAPLAWVALAPFLVAAVRVRPLGAACLGTLWGVLMGLGVAWWLPAMIAGYFELPAVAGWLGFLVVALGLTAWYVAAFAAWLSWIARRRPVGPLLVAAGWGAAEFARARLLVGNPWALSAYSQVRFLTLVQIADLAGPYGIGMLIAATNAAIAGLAAPPLRARRPLAAVGALGAALVATLAYGEHRLSQTFTTGEPVTVALVQGAVERGFGWRPEYQHLGVDRYLALTRAAGALRPRLVVWPESAISAYLQEPTPEQRAILEESRELGADLLLGGPHYEFAGRRTLYHNSIFAVRRGRVTGRYDKLRLLPLAEENLPSRLLAREKSFTPGARATLLEAGDLRIGAFICWEAMYPELVREFALAGADLLANLSNDAWFGDAAPARLHLDIASLRAIENRRYLLRATATGLSAVIDPYGRTLTVSRMREPEVLSATVRPSGARTPYQGWGDFVAWTALALALAAALVRLRFLPPTTSHDTVGAPRTRWRPTRFARGRTPGPPAATASTIRVS